MTSNFCEKFARMLVSVLPRAATRVPEAIMRRIGWFNLAELLVQVYGPQFVPQLLLLGAPPPDDDPHAHLANLFNAILQHLAAADAQQAPRITPRQLARAGARANGGAAMIWDARFFVEHGLHTWAWDLPLDVAQIREAKAAAAAAPCPMASMGQLRELSFTLPAPPATRDQWPRLVRFGMAQRFGPGVVVAVTQPHQPVYLPRMAATRSRRPPPRIGFAYTGTPSVELPASIVGVPIATSPTTPGTLMAISSSCEGGGGGGMLWMWSLRQRGGGGGAARYIVQLAAAPSLSPDTPVEDGAAGREPVAVHLRPGDATASASPLVSTTAYVCKSSTDDGGAASHRWHWAWHAHQLRLQLTLLRV